MNLAGEKIKATVPFVLIGITKKHAWDGTGRKLVWGGSIDIGKTKATKDSKLRIVWVTKKEREVRCCFWVDTRWTDVKKKRSSA